MNETEQNTQRIMTELLAAHAQTKRMLAQIKELENTCAEWERQYNHRMEIDQAEYDGMTSDYLRMREIAHGMEAAIRRTIEYFETSGFDDADAEAVKVLRDAIEATK